MAKNRLEYDGGPKEFEDLDFGFNIVKINAFGCKTDDKEKNKKGFDVNWWMSFQDINNSSKSTIYNLMGNFDWEDGRISPKSFLLAKVNLFFDAVGFMGGFNIDGELEEEDGNKISQSEFFEKYGKAIKDIRLAVYVYRNESNTFTNVYYAIKPKAELNSLKKIIEHDIETGFLKIFNENTAGIQTQAGSSVSTGKPLRL
jgi:hypothetical protein